MKPSTAGPRPRAVRTLPIVPTLLIVLVSLAIAACQATSVLPSGSRTPSPRSSASAGSSVDPSGSPSALPTLFPLPRDMVPDGDISIAPETARTAESGRPYPYQLGHCGIGSPIDFDGSLWDPTGAQNGKGAEATDQQLGELVNSSNGTMTLVGADSAMFRTTSGLILGLARHQGAKTFPGCA